MICPSLKQVSITGIPNRSDEQDFAACVLEDGHLGSHQGRALGKHWWWNEHGHGIMRPQAVGAVARTGGTEPEGRSVGPTTRDASSSFSVGETTDPTRGTPMPNEGWEANRDRLVRVCDKLLADSEVHRIGADQHYKCWVLSVRIALRQFRVLLADLHTPIADPTRGTGEAPHHDHCPARDGEACICGLTLTADDLAEWGERWVRDTRDVAQHYGDVMVPCNKSWLENSARYVELMAAKLRGKSHEALLAALQEYGRHKSECELLTKQAEYITCPHCNGTGRATDPKHQMKQRNGQPWPDNNCAPCAGNPNYQWLQRPTCTCGLSALVARVTRREVSEAAPTDRSGA